MGRTILGLILATFVWVAWFIYPLLQFNHNNAWSSFAPILALYILGMMCCGMTVLILKGETK